MNYLYDIVLNFNDKNLYEYFDWDSEDYLINIKKVPFFKVDYKTIYDIYNYKVKINKAILKKINCIYYKKLNIDYIIVISNKEKTLGLGIDKDGNVLYKSCLTYEDEIYSNKLVESMKEKKITYKIIDKKIKNYVLRSESIKKSILYKEFKKRYYLKNYDVLRYFYLEVFDMDCENIKDAYVSLVKGLDKYLDKYDKVFNLLNNS